MCHVNSIRQTVRVVSIEHPTGVLRTGDRAKMIFEFLQQPEFVQEGARLIVRESRSKLLGVVTRLLD
jgi:GTPase